MAKTRKFVCNIETKWRRNVIKFKTNQVELGLLKIILYRIIKKRIMFLPKKKILMKDRVHIFLMN